MMDDKELVEVWRKQFIDLSRLGSVAAIYERDRFLNREVELRWQGFLMAKRSQPVIELPEILYEWDMERDSDQKVQYLDYENTVNAITAAGIKYTIGE